MKLLLWQEWSQCTVSQLRDCEFDVWMLTALAAAVLALSAVELVRGRSRFWGVLVLLNVAFALLAGISMATSVAYGASVGSDGLLRMPEQERLAMVTRRTLAGGIGWFYLSFWFVILLTITRMRRPRRQARTTTSKAGDAPAAAGQ